MKKRILITGGCGFIGSNLVKAYITKGHNVTVIDSLVNGKVCNLGDTANSDKCKIIFNNVVDVDLVSVMKDIDIVHHVAAIPRVKYSVDHPIETTDENITNTVIVLDAARQANVDRVIYSSSSSVYGNTKYFPTHESTATNPRSPYALQKYVGEEYCRLYSELYGLDTVSLRYFNVFGPNSFADSQYSAVIPIFIERLTKGKMLMIDGDGEQTRDFTYVDNVVHGNILAAQCKKKLNGQVINIACGDNISINALAQRLAKIMEVSYKVRHREPRPGDVKKTQANVMRAKSVLGFEPVVSFDEGLKVTVKWYLEYMRCKENET